LVSNLQVILASHKGKSHPKLQQELPQMTEQGRLQITLLRFLAQSQEIKVVRIFENLPGQFRLRCRKRPVKVD
jgi:hypothetical protein